jgi:aminopeptidase N
LPTDGGSTDEFISLAEQISGQQLDELFDTWLFTPGKPVVADALSLRRSAKPQGVENGPAARSLRKLALKR